MSCSDDFAVFEDEHPLEKSCSNLEKLRKLEDFKDLEIKVKDGEIVVAQKIVLAARIPFLRKVISMPTLYWDRENVDNECAESIVSYAYTGRLKVTINNVAKFVSFSKTLQLDQIVNFCTYFIIERLDLDNLPLFWTLSKDLDLLTLNKKCIHLMRGQFEDLVSSSLFIQLNLEEFKSLISSDELNVSSEVSVFGAIKSWIQADSQVDRKKDLVELVKCIRWGQTNVEFRKSLARDEEIVRQSSSCVMYLLNVEHDISNGRDLYNPNPRTSRIAEQVIFTLGEPLSSEGEWIAESFDPATERSSFLAHLTFRVGAAVVPVGWGKVMISGGRVDGIISSSVELFSCPEKQSSPVASLNVPRFGHGSCSVNEAVIVCGGCDEEEDDLNSCEVFFQDRWSHLPAMIEARWGVVVVSSPYRRVFAIGGCRGASSLSSVEVCRLPDDFGTPLLTTGFWKSLAPMREPRNEPAAIILQRTLLVAGGYHERSGNLSSVEMLPIDQEGAPWISLPTAMNEKRFHFFSLVVSSLGIFAFGNDEDPCNSVERLNFLTNVSWKTKSTSQSIIEEVSAAKWESLSPIKSMKAVHRAVLISNNSL